MSEDFQQLEKALSDLAPLNPTELARLVSLFHPLKLEKMAHFVEAGRPSFTFGFVAQGLLCSYYLDEGGDEFIKSFFVEHDFVSAYEALLTGEPSAIFIQALEDCHLLVADYREYQALLDTYPAWQIVSRKMAEKGVLRKEARERQFLMQDAEARYLEFLRKYPGLESRLKQHQVAAYLGITPVSLSRIRTKLHRA